MRNVEDLVGQQETGLEKNLIRMLGSVQSSHAAWNDVRPYNARGDITLHYTNSVVAPFGT